MLKWAFHVFSPSNFAIVLWKSAMQLIFESFAKFRRFSLVYFFNDANDVTPKYKDLTVRFVELVST